MHTPEEKPSLRRRAWYPHILVFRFVRWLFSRRTLGRLLFLLACLATLVALFYAEENWRGSRAWNQFKKEGEAKGERFDMAAFIPPPVPDDQNFAMAPLLKPLLDYDVQHGRIVWRDTNGWKRVTAITFHPRRVSHETAVLLNRPRPFLETYADLALWQQAYREQAEWLKDEMDSPSRRPPGRPKTDDILFPVPDKPGDPGADVLLALSLWDGEFRELKAASARPSARYPVRYEEGFSALLPHLSVLKQLTMLLNLRATAYLQVHRPDQAFDDVMLGFRLADSLQTEPFLISQVVRVAYLTNLMPAIWEGLGARRWSDDQLAAFQKQLQVIQLLPDYNRSLRTECAMVSQVAGELMQNRADSKNLRVILSGSSDPGELEFTETLIRYSPSGWLRLNQVAFCRIRLAGLIPSWDSKDPMDHQPPPEPLPDSRQGESLRPWNFLVKSPIWFEQSPIKFVRTQTYIHLALVACALERHFLAQGSYPSQLDTLAPRFIPAVPRDVMSGAPLKYRRTEDGRFVLYSVGPDKADDGGAFPTRVPDPNPAAARSGEELSREEGDWVWRYPARPISTSPGSSWQKEGAGPPLQGTGVP